MAGKTITGAVGNPAGLGKYPVNQPNDVLFVKGLLYRITSKEGGPVAADWPVCDPAGGGSYHPKLQELILNFQRARKAKGVPMQGEDTAGGRVMPGSATLSELIRVAAICAGRLQDTSPGPNGYLSAGLGGATASTPVNWNPAPANVPLAAASSGSFTFEDFITGLIGKRTSWQLSGGPGFSVGIWLFGFGTGGLNITRPDGSSFALFTMSASAGISLAPASLSFSGPETPGGAIGGVYANGSAALTDSDFVGPFLTLSGSVMNGGIEGNGVSLTFAGYGNCLPGWSAIAALAAGPVGPLLALLRSSRVVGMSWGKQYGTPDTGASIALGNAYTPATLKSSTDLLDKHGPKF